MLEQQFRIAEIEVAKSPTDEKIVGLFRYDQAGQLHKNGTTLLIIAEIASTLYVYERLLDVINATAEQAKHLVAGVEQDPLARFEKLIQHVNEAVARFLEGEPNPISWGRVNVFLIEFSQGHLCLAGRGRLMNLFLQKQLDGHYRTFDLLGSLEQPVDLDPEKPFGSLICGDMKPGDALMIGTNNFERLRQELELRERITTLPAVTAALEIKQDIERRGTPDDFVAAIVTSCELERPMPAPQATMRESDVPRSVQSIEKLEATQQDAHQNLAPTSLMPSRTPLRIWKTVRGKLHDVFQDIGYSLRKRFNGDRLKDVAALTSLRGMSAGHGSMFTPERKKTAVVLGGAIIILLIALLGWRYHNRSVAEAALWQQAYEQAQDNRNRAESDLVYGNDGRAKTEIETAEGLLQRLSTNDADQQKKRDVLSEDLRQLRERLRKIINADPVTELVVLTDAPDHSLSAPVLIKDTAYAIDNAKHAVLKIDLTNKTIKQVALPDNAEAIVAGAKGKTDIVFGTQNGKFLSLDLKTDVFTPLSGGLASSTITDLIVYGGRLYVLDGTTGKISKAQLQTTSVGNFSGYIKASNTPVTGATSLAIDSNVYVLAQDGNLARYLSGGQEGFSLASIDPPLQAGTAIWTTADATRLVIADQGGKRVLIYNKDGSLKAQLLSNEWHTLNDLDADEVTKRLLVVDGNRLLLAPLP